MKNKRFSFIVAAVVAALVISGPLYGVATGPDLRRALRDVKDELKQDYRRRQDAQVRLKSSYDNQHKKMIEEIKKCNELSLMLYSQKSQFTFDLSFALQRVSREYKVFNSEKRPYDLIVSNLDMEIDRYARLLETLRRLPPEIKELNVIPDSLTYHNDTLELHLSQNQMTLEKEVAALALSDTTSSPFVLDKQGELDRDSCIYFASELLKIYVASKERVVNDSTHYREAYLRLKESYDYAQKRYEILKQSIFVDGQTKWWKIMSRPERYWKLAVRDFNSQYSFKDMLAYTETGAITMDDGTVVYEPTAKVENTLQLMNVPLQIAFLLVFWAAAAILMWLLFLIFKPAKKKIAKQQRPFITLLVGIIAYMIFLTTTKTSDPVSLMALSLTRTFLWLLAAIVTALLIRVKPEHLKYSIRLYLPNIFMALFVIYCRSSFMPNSMMNFVFPAILLVIVIWQLVVSLKYGRKAPESDSFFCWIAFVVTFSSFMLSAFGYNFLALMVLVWWYIQLAVIQTIAALWYITTRYRDTRMTRRSKQYLTSKAISAGLDKDAALFRITWFYDLIKDVIIPGLALLSIPACIQMALDVFDFQDMFHTFYFTPFVDLHDKTGESTFQLSISLIVTLIAIYFLFSYARKAIRAIYQDARYSAFERKNKRRTVSANEINLSLGNSLINVLVWMTYIVIVVVMLHIPTGSLSLVAGGLSAGVGLALKDIINNFIYGIQLMSGRLRVGDWIECDGTRGRVTAISYQSTQIETTEGTMMSFLNASLFAKNFTNLTRNNSYEFTKIIVGVAYGTDIQKVREVIETAMQKMCTKDAYGRDIVEPKAGVYVRFGGFGDSSVEIAVKQYVLVPERIAYIDRAKETIYNALYEAGITIPFPQCDVHMIKDDL